MAVDTKAKSLSVLGMGAVNLPVLPESVSGEADSFHLLHLFADPLGEAGAVGETVAVSDSVSSTIVFAEFVSESVAVVDSPSTISQESAGINEDVSVADLPIGVTPGQEAGGYNDDLAVVDAVTANSSIMALIDEQLAVVDANTGDLPSPEAASVAEVLSVTDECTGLIPGEQPPEDPDNTPRTEFIDCDGEGLLVPQITMLHSADSLRNVDLSGPERARQDAFEALFDRTDKGRNVGRTFRLLIWAARAGYALSIREIEIEYEVVGETTTRDRVT